MSLKEYDLKVLNVKKGGLSGRCQRVSSVVTESDGSENVAPQQKTVEPLQLVDYPAETKSKKKPNLSKYIDDNIRNFDLLTKRRDRSSTSSDSTTHSNGSTNSSFEKEVSNLSSAKENVLTNNQVHPKVVPDTTNAAPKAVETPSKRNKSKTSKFSIDAVESPKAPVAAVPALASVLARSSSILARTKKSAQPPPATAVPAVSIEPISMTPVAIDPSVVQERRNSRSHSGALYWHDTDVPAAAITTTAAADLTTGSCNNTATNTNAPTVAFKKTASVNANEPSKVASEQEKELAAIEASRSKKVSFNASAGAVGVAAAASSVGALEPAPACPSSQAKSARRSASGAAADAHHNHSSHGHGNSNCNSGGISSSGSRATPSRTPSSASVSTGNSSEIALSQQQQSHQQSSSLQAAGGGILGDPARSVELNGRHYIRLNVLGKGGSSCVYRIIGAEDGQVYAYKRVEVKESEDMDAVFDNYANEIALLRRLSSAAQTTAPGSETAENGAAAGGGAVSTESSAVVAAGVTGAQSRIIELVDFEVRRDERYIAMILEAGDIDLAKVLQQKNTARSANPSNSTDGAGIQHLLDPFFARMVWREMLEAVDHIHQHRIVHGDLKPANFVFVKGHLKLIDFGIAKSFNSDTTNIYRESQIGTINYMAPEAIAPMSDEDSNNATSDRLKMRLGRASDIWSLGCILYQMVYGRPPFAALNTIQKLSTIPNPKHVIKYADWGDGDAVDSMQACLRHDPRLRSKIRGPEGLLERAYLQVPGNIQRDAGGNGTANTTANVTQQPAAIGKEQVQCIVGAVLDSLSNVAQQAVVKAQAAGRGSRVATRNTRSGGRNNGDAEAAEKMAQSIVKWIDEVDQEVVEVEVMEVVLKQEWSLAPVGAVGTSAGTPQHATTTVPTLPVAPVQAPASVAKSTPLPSAPTAPIAPAVVPTPSEKASATSSASVSSGRVAAAPFPTSPSPSRKRKADSDAAPLGSNTLTRSASKRAALGSNRSGISSSTFSSAVKASAGHGHGHGHGYDDFSQEVTANLVPFSSATSATSASAKKSTPAKKGTASPRALTAKPAFLSGILGAPKLTAFLQKSTAVSADVAPISSSAGRGSASSSGMSGSAAAPAKVLPFSLQQEILHSAVRRSSLQIAAAEGAAAGETAAPVVDRAARWIRQAPVETDLRTELEKRIGAMRKFMNYEDENDGATETMDATGFNFF